MLVELMEIRVKYVVSYMFVAVGADAAVVAVSKSLGSFRMEYVNS